MNPPSMTLVYCRSTRSYRDAAGGARMLPEDFAFRVIEGCPDRVALTVSATPLEGGIRILSADQGWRVVVPDPSDFALRCLLSPELARSVDYQCWLNARHRMLPAFAALLEQAAPGAGEAWLLLEELSDQKPQ